MTVTVPQTPSPPIYFIIYLKSLDYSGERRRLHFKLAELIIGNDDQLNQIEFLCQPSGHGQS